jgi:hypothetical protein
MTSNEADEVACTVGAAKRSVGIQPASTGGVAGPKRSSLGAVSAPAEGDKGMALRRTSLARNS